MTLTPNDFYGRSCEVSGHILGNYEDTKRCIFCGEFESQQEDKMCECGNGGCSACHTKDESPLHFIASGKEIEELYRISLDNDYPEDLWVDPAEADLPDAP
jgi:hypothetical protein